MLLISEPQILDLLHLNAKQNIVEKYLKGRSNQSMTETNVVLFFFSSNLKKTLLFYDRGSNLEVWLDFLSTAPSGTLAVPCCFLICRFFCKISSLFLRKRFSLYHPLPPTPGIRQTVRWHFRVSFDKKVLRGSNGKAEICFLKDEYRGRWHSESVRRTMSLKYCWVQ